MKPTIVFLFFSLSLFSQRCYSGIVTQGNAKLIISANATVVTDGMVNNGTILNSGTLDNNGDFTNNGTALVEGLVKFTGTTSQTISGSSDFITVHVANAAGVSLAAGANVTINEVLELRTGTFATGSANLTFLSTSVTHCAIIDNFSPGFSGTMSGPITAQRYHNAASGTFNQHLMGSPINSGAFSSFTTVSGTDGVAVTPTSDCDETQLDPSSNYGSIFEWNEALVSSCHLEGWVVRSSGGMSNGQGYGVAIAGAGTVSVSGTPNLNASYTQTNLNNSNWNTTSLQGLPYSSGWHLLSNPYLASFDLDGAANSAFDNFVQVMNTHGGFAGTYQPLSMSSSTLLPPFQAFMVRKTNAGAGTFTFNGSDRSLGTAAFHKVEALEGSMEILVEGNTYADITYLQFDPASTTTYDPQFDAYKFLSAPGHPTIYTRVGTDWLSINTNPDVASTPVVPMGFRPGANGSFTFTAQQMNLPVGVTAILEDVQLNVFQSLNTDPTYTFASQVSDSPDRFNVHFTTVTEVENLLVEDVRTWSNGSQVFVQPLNLEEQATVNVFDATGRLLLASSVQPNIQTTIDLTHKATGVVIVQVTTSKNAFTEKLIITQ
jgi:hypothetical protein